MSSISDDVILDAHKFGCTWRQFVIYIYIYMLLRQSKTQVYCISGFQTFFLELEYFEEKLAQSKTPVKLIID